MKAHLENQILFNKKQYDDISYLPILGEIIKVQYGDKKYAPVSESPPLVYNI